MGHLVVAVVAIGGGLLGPLLRGQILHHTVPAGTAWRTACPHCAYRLVRPGLRALRTVLPPSGRCPACGQRIGPPPGVVEAVTALVLAALAWRVPAPLTLLALCWVAVLGVALAFVDAAVHRLPDRLTLAAFAGAVGLLGAATLAGGRPGQLRTALVCALAVAGFYLILALISPAGMGLGDGKAAFSVGLATGWFGWPVAFLGTAAGFLFAGLFAAALLVLRRAGRKDHIPHGPFMFAGALTAILLAGGGPA